MAERLKAPPAAGMPVLQIAGLNVFYGRSHAVQGVDLTLQHGVLSVVGRNGMGKTTMCKAIMGLVPIASGSIRFFGEEIAGRSPAEVARLGIGYVPQGRRLWRSLTVDEHLRLMQRGKRGAWTPERIYEVFPRLAERRNNGGGQLSGGEQQMLAISRALLLNPRLLIMDEPTEGLAPVIVAHVEEMLVRLAEQGDVAILVIEQNIGVATQMSDPVAIMVNGRINRIIASATLAGDRDLQQRLLGVGRHGHDETDAASEAAPTAGASRPAALAPAGPTRVYISNPVIPNRWSHPVPAARIEAQARTVIVHARGVVVLIAPHRENDEGNAVAQRSHDGAVPAMGDDGAGFGEDFVMRCMGKNCDIRRRLKAKSLECFAEGDDHLDRLPSQTGYHLLEHAGLPLIGGAERYEHEWPHLVSWRARPVFVGPARHLQQRPHIAHVVRQVLGGKVEAAAGGEEMAAGAQGLFVNMGQRRKAEMSPGGVEVRQEAVP